MGLFSLTPTFTQGLVLGQFSIFFLLALILRYLFFDSSVNGIDSPHVLPSTPLVLDTADTEDEDVNTLADQQPLKLDVPPVTESAEWFNILLNQIVQVYRAEACNHSTGSAAAEASRAKVERWMNDRMASGVLDSIRVHSVDLGKKAPKFSNARIRAPDDPSERRIDLDLTYTDSISLSLSTCYLFNYPSPSFARLPISLTLSLSLFSGTVTITPPLSSSPTPSLTLSLHPSFELSLKTSSLLGSRAKLSDVPKLHQLIEARIRSTIAEKATWKVLLPGVGLREDLAADKVDRL